MEILQAIRADLAAHTDMLNVLTQDVAFIRARIVGHDRLLDVIKQDVRMVRTAINDMEKTRFTSGEAAVLHEDVERVENRIADLEVRVAVIEGRREPPPTSR